MGLPKGGATATGSMFGPLGTVVGLGLEVGSQIYGGMVESAQAKSMANIANYNAQVQEREAKAIEQRSIYESQRQAEAGSRDLSTLESRGAPVEVLGVQAKEFERENLMIGYEGQVASARAKAQAAADRMQAKVYKSAASSAKTASYIGAGTTLLTGWNKSNELNLEHKRRMEELKYYDYRR